LAGEGWGGGVSAMDTPDAERAPTRRFAPTSPASAGQSHLKENLVGWFLCGPSFETPAFGGLLRMRSCFAAKSYTLMVRSAACGASRTMKPSTRKDHMR